METEYINIVFKNGGKNYSFSPNELKLKKGNLVVVETSKGFELGICASKILKKEKFDSPLKPVLRIATAKDISQKKLNDKRQIELKEQIEKIVKNRKLNMKITNVELSLYGNKMLVNFFSNERVDFRELIKELVATFKSKIELRQIGEREETAILGGIGLCGKEVCCHQFGVDNFQCSIKMAKLQGLALNPSKISGLCGKLKCCLDYENSDYQQAFNEMPQINTEATTPDGRGLVIYNDLLNKRCTIKFEKNKNEVVQKEYSLSEIKDFKRGKDKNR